MHRPKDIAAPQPPVVAIPRSVVMVGLMGAGKSAIGRRLAQRLGLPFVDADHEIEQAAGRSIEDIFQTLGEQAFRDGERKIVQRLLDGPRCVLATGGGAFVDPETRTKIRSQAISIWLDADLELLLKRVSRRSNRPLLKQGDPREVLMGLIAARNPIYAEADIRVESVDGPPEATVDRVVEALTRFLQNSGGSAPSAEAVEKVRVELGARGYDIVIAPRLFEEAGSWLGDLLDARRRLIVVSDEKVAAAQWPRLTKGLAAAGIEAPLITLPAGESTKDWTHLGQLIERILDLKPERGTLLMALGGGVVGDIVGLAASLTLRGLDFIQAPTTLLAQVDSAVGGKTGVNTRHGKNLVGIFHQPRRVLADLDALDTLPRRELAAGYAEVVKYGLIDDAPFFAWLEDNGARLLEGDRERRAYAVAHSCRAKARVVAADEREQGARALLNLGHTFGHAFEAAIGFGEELLHGEAVAIGLTLAFDLSARLGLCPPGDAARVHRHLAGVGLPVRLPPRGDGRPWQVDELVALMGQDKKVKDGRITFILVRGVGKAFIVRDVDPAAVAASLAAIVPS